MSHQGGMIKVLACISSEENWIMYCLLKEINIPWKIVKKKRKVQSSFVQSNCGIEVVGFGETKTLSWTSVAHYMSKY